MNRRELIAVTASLAIPWQDPSERIRTIWADDGSFYWDGDSEDIGYVIERIDLTTLSPSDTP